MSVAFTREEDLEATAADLPDRPISPHPNLVTPAGLAAIEAALAEARAAYAAAQAQVVLVALQAEREASPEVQRHALADLQAADHTIPLQPPASAHVDTTRRRHQPAAAHIARHKAIGVAVRPEPAAGHQAGIPQLGQQTVQFS